MYYESLLEGYKAVGFSYDYYGQQIPFTEEGRFTVRGRARGGSKNGRGTMSHCQRATRLWDSATIITDSRFLSLRNVGRRIDKVRI